MSLNEENLKYEIAVTLIPGVGDVLAKNLVSYCGSVEAVFRQKKAHLLKIPDIGPVVAESIVKHRVFERAEQEVEFIRRHSITPLFYLSDAYPFRLRHCYDAPVMLYYKGNADLNTRKVLAVVGTRNATEYGKSFCEELIHDLEGSGVMVVSGLAYGIDVHAHKCALRYSLPTVGVVGHGLDRIYPAVNKPVAAKMTTHGGILTEFMSGTRPNAENFPARNRIVAGMVDAVVIIEAALRGGALITAEIANSYSKDVFAVPGRTTDIYSQGCNWLVRTNRAGLITSAKDLEHSLGWQKEEVRKAAVQKPLFADLTAEESLLMQLLEKEAMGVDRLSVQSGMPVSRTLSLLLGLEFQGLVKALPGKVYQIA
jgi:DNA processing protein